MAAASWLAEFSKLYVSSDPDAVGLMIGILQSLTDKLTDNPTLQVKAYLPYILRKLISPFGQVADLEALFASGLVAPDYVYNDIIATIRQYGRLDLEAVIDCWREAYTQPPGAARDLPCHRRVCNQCAIGALQGERCALYLKSGVCGAGSSVKPKSF